MSRTYWRLASRKRSLVRSSTRRRRKPWRVTQNCSPKCSVSRLRVAFPDGPRASNVSAGHTVRPSSRTTRSRAQTPSAPSTASPRQSTRHDRFRGDFQATSRCPTSSSRAATNRFARCRTWTSRHSIVRTTLRLCSSSRGPVPVRRDSCPVRRELGPERGRNLRSSSTPVPASVIFSPHPESSFALSRRLVVRVVGARVDSRSLRSI